MKLLFSYSGPVSGLMDAINAVDSIKDTSWIDRAFIRKANGSHSLLCPNCRHDHIRVDFKEEIVVCYNCGFNSEGLI